MTAHVVGVLAEILAEHQPRYGGADSIACSHPDCEGVEWEPEHVASVVAALPSIAIIEHIAPTKDEDCGQVWLAGVMAEGFFLDAQPGSICDFGGTEYTVAEARQYAAAMLSAAAAAARATGGQA